MARKYKNWVNAYLDYTSEHESPRAFHYWTAMTVLSAALGRHLYMDRGYYTLYPNLFVLLIAGSAKCRKSISTGLGVNLLRGMKEKVLVFSQKITNEALIAALHETKRNNQCSGLIYASELSVFMGQDAHKSGLIPTLTDLYDSPSVWSYRTRGRGIEELQNVTLCLLGASTKEWLKISIPADAVGGGFTSRVIFVYQDQMEKPILFPKLKRDYSQTKEWLISDLNHIRTQRGSMELTPEARIFAETWYHREVKIERDIRLEGYYGRKHDTMFKLGMLLSISEGDEKWITEYHITEALRILEANEHSLHYVVATVTATAIGEQAEKILGLIRKYSPKIPHSELLKRCWRFADSIEVSQHIRTLLEAEEIVEGMSRDSKTRYYAIKNR